MKSNRTLPDYKHRDPRAFGNELTWLDMMATRCLQVLAGVVVFWLIMLVW